MKQNLRSVTSAAFASALALGAGTASGQEGPVSGPAASPLAIQLQTEAYWTSAQMGAAKPMERHFVMPEGAALSEPAGATPGVAGLARGATAAEAQAYAAQIGAILDLPAGLAAPQWTQAMPSNPKDGPYGPFQRFSQAGTYTTYPISTVGKLFFKIGTANYVCSGTAINRSTVATAGHCVAAGNNSTWYNTFLFCPSYNAGGVNPNVGCWSGVVPVTSGPWFASGNPNYDYACIVTATTGTLKAGKMGNYTGWAGRAWNWGELAEASMGYPQAAPFDGNRIQVNIGPDWYSYGFGVATTGVGASKFMGNDLTGGSSGGPWILGYRGSFEYADTDGNFVTDSGGAGFYVNGNNSHKRCAGGTCASPPTAAAGVFWQEMSSPRYTSGVHASGSEEVFAVCFSNANNN